MILSFLKIRATQILRSIKDIGILRILFLLMLVFIFAYALYKLSAVSENSYIIVVCFFILISIYHFIRKDKLFIKISFDRYRLLYFVEYLIYCIPAIICFLYYGHWLQFFLMLGLPAVIAQLDFNYRHRHRNFKILKLIPDKSFEWKSGIRKVFIIIMILWLAGISGAFFIGTVPIIIFIIGIIPAGFYSLCEPYQMLIAFETGTPRFLFTKIKMHIIMFSVIVIPLIVMFLIFHLDLWYIVVAEYFIFISVHIYQILTKYAFFEPNEKSSAAQIFEIMGILAILIPLFLPLVWIMSVFFYFRSRRKLNIYLNDYN